MKYTWLVLSALMLALGLGGSLNSDPITGLYTFFSGWFFHIFIVKVNN